MNCDIMKQKGALGRLLFFTKGYCKMNFLRIRTGGFRNIEDSSLELSDLTALISLNSYGKSNLLTAIDFGIDFISANCTEKEEMMHYQPGIPLNRDNLLRNYFFEMEAETLLESQSYLFSYRFEFQWRANSQEPGKIISEQLKAKENKKGQKYNLLISRADMAYYRSAKTGRCTTAISIENNELVVNKLKAFDGLYFLSLLKQINTIAVYIDRHLDASGSYIPDPIIRKGLSELDIEGIENIPRTISYLQREYPDKYELLKDAYMQLFPNITDIDVREFPIESQGNIPSGDDVPFVFCNYVYIMRVTDNYLSQPISFERLSDGAKRVFLMLTFAIIADIKGLSLIAFEEPENSIHPSLLQSFLRVITQLTSNCKIIITSHSPYMLQYIQPNDIYIGIPNDKNLAAFRPIADGKVRTLLKDVAYADTSVGDYIFELMSGSQNDVDQLNQYLERGHE